MSVAENVAFPLKLRIAKAECEQRVEEALNTVQLSELGNRRIDQLSEDKDKGLPWLGHSCSNQESF